MARGIKINNKHSYTNYGLRLTSRSIGSAKRQEHIERIPFSNVSYNFDSLFTNGISYDDRKLSYSFEFRETDVSKAETKLDNILAWLSVTTTTQLYDDYLPTKYFEVRQPDVTFSESHSIYKITVTFSASPLMKVKGDS